ncbi:MAG: DUF2190 family protein [Chloroflexi bacterium]|nr:DUF2190 family protein [Chloroflexota bacterium]
MADLTRTPASVADVWPLKTKKHPLIAAVDIAAGQPLYIDANGKANIADANGSAPANTYIGIAMQSIKAGQAVDAAVEGDVVGFDLSGLAYGAAVYVSNTAGELADAAGTATLLVGYVYPMTDPDRSKVLHLSKV